MNDIAKLLNPNSIAVIGASPDKSKLGTVILQRLIEFGFEGDIFPVHLHATKILGKRAYHSVLDIESPVDLALIAIPANFVAEVLKECGQKGIKNAVVISAGFAEVGGVGAALQSEIELICKQFDISLIGPNCLGFINTRAKLDLTFSAPVAQKGHVACVSQSGAVGTAFLDWAASREIGLSHFVSLGNKAVINENDLLAHFAANENVRAIILYIEDFRDGEKFMQICSNTTKLKPVIMLVPGKSAQTAAAISSHTGSMASSNKVISTALKQAGAVEVKNLEELFNIVKFIEDQPLPKNDKVAILTNAGGLGVLSIDEIADSGLQLAKFSQITKTALAKTLPAAGSYANPVDLLGDASAELYQKAAQIIAADEGVGSVLALLSPQMTTRPKEVANVLNSVADKSQLPVAASFVGGELVAHGIDELEEEQIPHYSFPGDAARTLGNAVKIMQAKSSIPRTHNPKYINSALKPADASGMIAPLQAYELAAQYKLPLVPNQSCDLFGDNHYVAQKIGYPVVLKLSHPALAHKTEFEAVELDIKDDSELQEATLRLQNAAKEARLKGAKLEIQKYIKDKIEVFVGVNKDPQTSKNKGFGHVLLIGTGGIYTEIYADTTMRILPVNKRIINTMLSETKIGEVIDGARGKTYSEESLIEAIVNLSNLVQHNTNIKSIDINPLFVTPDACYVADLKVYV